MSKPTTYDRVGHYIGNHLSATFNFDRIGHPLSPKGLEEERRGLISGLEETLEHLEKAEIKVSHGIGKAEIKKLLKLTKGMSWDEKDAREVLMGTYNKM